MDYLLTQVKGTSRWDPSRFIAFRTDVFDPLNSYLVDSIQALSAAGTYTVQDDANRPDMICAAIYRDDMTLWWLLMLYNGMWDYSSPTHYLVIPVGTEIRYFSLDDLERLYFTLAAKQKASPT